MCLQVVDYFKPSGASSWCKMLTSVNRHMWPPTGLDGSWRVPKYYRNAVNNGGSLIDWPKDFVEGDEKLVMHKKIRYNNKRNQLEFFPRFLRKPLLSMRVGRYYGLNKGKCNIDYDKRYYDFKNDRMIFILENK